MKAKNKKKQITLVEFKAWLCGVEEMQSPDWHPDAIQWKAIRAKLNTVKESPQYFEEPVIPYRPPVPPPPVRRVNTQQMPHEPPMVQSESGPLSTTLLSNPNTPILEHDLSSNVPGTKSSGLRVKTPNIDTSDGRGYQPAFE